jgi:hypothetical protein
MRISSLLFSLLLAGSVQAQPRWQVGVESRFAILRYSTVHTNGLFRAKFSVPSGAGALVLSRPLPYRGLSFETGLGCQPIPVAYSVINRFPNSSTSFNGVSLWTIPFLIRDDVQQALFNSQKRKNRLYIKGGLLINAVTGDLGKSGIHNINNNSEFWAHSRIVSRATASVYVGLDYDFSLIKNRLHIIVQRGYTIGFIPIIETTIQYVQPSGLDPTVVRTVGSSNNFLGLSLRYAFWGKSPPIYERLKPSTIPMYESPYSPNPRR